ncbi:carbonic anhydrase 4-like [Mixophyes fleayi]|uniref:carbonic anhydrase 4-like n=1 Tax=Mixophyes fleayi TaxID=3061075 RepID=UPI003F4E30AA
MGYLLLLILSGKIAETRKKLEDSSQYWCYKIQANGHCKAPADWKDIEECGGDKQSPIDIVTKNAHYKSELTPFHFTGYDVGNNCILKNNGHSVQLDLPAGQKTISGGGLSSTYTTAQFHFHWGSNGKAGSEHTKEGHQYPIELHIVHLKAASRSESGGTVTETGSGAYAVLGFFIEESAEENTNYNSIIAGFSNISKAGTNTTISNIKLKDLIPNESDLKLYYRYEGSLTTPGCSETVTWTLFDVTIKLSKAQIEAFYTHLKYPSDDPMIENFRPVQELGSRTVYTSSADAVLSLSRHLLISLIALYVMSVS